MTFYSQNQIKYLQGFYRVLVDVRVLRGDTQWLKFGGTNDQASLTD